MQTKESFPMSAHSSLGLHNPSFIPVITEAEVIEASAHARLGDTAVLERFTPHMLSGRLTRGALFQLAFLVDDADVHQDLGLLYSVIVLQAANLVLGGDPRAWRELRTRPGKLGAFITALSGPDSKVLEAYRQSMRDTKPQHIQDTVLVGHDIFDVVLSRLHFNFELLSYLHDHFHDPGIKSIIGSLLRMRGIEHSPGNA